MRLYCAEIPFFHDLGFVQPVFPRNNSNVTQFQQFMEIIAGYYFKNNDTVFNIIFLNRFHSLLLFAGPFAKILHGYQCNKIFNQNLISELKNRQECNQYDKCSHTTISHCCFFIVNMYLECTSAKELVQYNFDFGNAKCFN